MNAAAGLALVAAALRVFVQYHALEAAIPYWSYILPFIHSLMGFGVFWALYLAAGRQYAVCAGAYGGFCRGAAFRGAGCEACGGFFCPYGRFG